jgi:hypothetical protein
MWIGRNYSSYLNGPYPGVESENFGGVGDVDGCGEIGENCVHTQSEVKQMTNRIQTRIWRNL